MSAAVAVPFVLLPVLGASLALARRAPVPAAALWLSSLAVGTLVLYTQPWRWYVTAAWAVAWSISLLWAVLVAVPRPAGMLPPAPRTAGEAAGNFIGRMPGRSDGDENGGSEGRTWISATPPPEAAPRTRIRYRTLTRPPRR